MPLVSELCLNSMIVPVPPILEPQIRSPLSLAPSPPPWLPPPVLESSHGLAAAVALPTTALVAPLVVSHRRGGAERQGDKASIHVGLAEGPVRGVDVVAGGVQLAGVHPASTNHTHRGRIVRQPLVQPSVHSRIPIQAV